MTTCTNIHNYIHKWLHTINALIDHLVKLSVNKPPNKVNKNCLLLLKKKQNIYSVK